MHIALEEDSEELTYLKNPNYSYIDFINKEKLVLILIILILLSELCERMSFYSVSANLVLFLNNVVGMSPSSSNALALAWTGTVYVTPILGAWIADSYFGRFKTILIFSLVYILGMGGIAVGSLNDYGTTQSWIFITSIFIVALGTGGLKCNVITFGAEQIEYLGEGEEVEQYKASYFAWFYLFVNIGALVSFTGVAYVQQNVSFFIGYIIPASAMILATILFFVGSKWYRKTKPSESVIERGIYIFFTCLFAPEDIKYRAESFLERAKYIRNDDGFVFQEEEVDNTGLVFRLIPMLSCFVMFHVVYSQMQSTFFSQGTVLNLRVGDIEIPVSSLNMINSIIIIFVVPLVDKGLYPLLRYFNINLTSFQKIGIGFVFATISIFYAGGLEVWRLSLFAEGKTILQLVGTKNVTAVDLSILAQTPSFFFIGLGEVFAVISGLEFCYSQAPETMKSLIVALFYLSIAIGSYLGSALVELVNINKNEPWIGTDLNKSHLDYYFFLLGGLSVLNLGIFSIIAWRFKPKEIIQPRYSANFQYSDY